MKKAIIGILPSIHFSKNNNPYEDVYKFVNNYGKRIIECGATPIGILLEDGKCNNDILDICDGFLFPGGDKIEEAHYEIIEYAIENNKPILGICLGMQAMACYSRLKEYATIRNINPTPENLISLRKKLQEENIYMLKKLDKGHIHGEKIMNDEIEITNENLLKSKHPIKIIPNTKLHKCFKSNQDIISLHSYAIYETSNDFKISATAEDNVIEAIEYIGNTWIIGIQFHPELELNNPIWNEFITQVNIQKQKEV